jgi:hypothetical protein
MEEIKHQLDRDFCISSPNVGDGEIREIVFSHPDVRLRIFLPVEKRMLSIQMVNVTFFSLVTDYPQNVLDRIAVYPGLEIARLHNTRALRYLVVREEFGSG